MNVIIIPAFQVLSPISVTEIYLILSHPPHSLSIYEVSVHVSHFVTHVVTLVLTSILIPRNQKHKQHLQVCGHYEVLLILYLYL